MSEELAAAINDVTDWLEYEPSSLDDVMPSIIRLKDVWMRATVKEHRRRHNLPDPSISPKGPNMGQPVTILSLDEFRKLHTLPVSPEAAAELQALHGIDISVEVENAIKSQYELYLKGGLSRSSRLTLGQYLDSFDIDKTAAALVKMQPDAFTVEAAVEHVRGELTKKYKFYSDGIGGTNRLESVIIEVTNFGFCLVAPLKGA